MTIEQAADLVRWEHGPNGSKPKLPPDSTPDLIQFVTENRAAVLRAAADRYLRVPPEKAHWTKQQVPRLESERTRVIEYATNQTQEVKSWITEQSKQSSQLQASVDLIAWQHAYKEKPVLFVLSLD